MGGGWGKLIGGGAACGEWEGLGRADRSGAGLLMVSGGWSRLIGGGAARGEWEGVDWGRGCSWCGAG